MTVPKSLQTQGPFLVSAESIGWASLFVNCILGLVLMLWNAIWLRRWGASLVLAILICSGVLGVLHRFTPHPAWFLVNCVLAMVLRKQAHSLFGLDYFRKLFDGARTVSVVPLISVLCAAQILALTPIVKRQWLADIDPVRHPRSLANNGQVGRYVAGRNTVEYRDCPQSRAELLLRTLIAVGYFGSAGEGWAGLDETPKGLRVTLRPIGPSQTQLGDLQFQKIRSNVDSALGAGGQLWLEVYGSDRQTVRRYLPTNRSQ
jgi:hypothetical protein